MAGRASSKNDQRKLGVDAGGAAASRRRSVATGSTRKDHQVDEEHRGADPGTRAEAPRLTRTGAIPTSATRSSRTRSAHEAVRVIIYS